MHFWHWWIKLEIAHSIWVILSYTPTLITLIALICLICVFPPIIPTLYLTQISATNISNNISNKYLQPNFSKYFHGASTDLWLFNAWPKWYFSSGIKCRTYNLLNGRLFSQKLNQWQIIVNLERQWIFFNQKYSDPKLVCLKTPTPTENTG